MSFVNIGDNIINLDNVCHICDYDGRIKVLFVGGEERFFSINYESVYFAIQPTSVMAVGIKKQKEFIQGVNHE